MASRGLQHEPTSLPHAVPLALFQSFMDSSPAIAWLRDCDSRYVYLNKTYLDRFGIRLEDRLGKRPEDVWPAEIARAFVENDRAVLAADTPLEVVEEAPDPDGAIHFWLNLKFPFNAADGGRYVGGVGVDITERKQAEEERQRRDARAARMQRLESLGLMAAGAAHDFNNLLTIVLGNASAARETLDPIAPALEHLRAIEEASRQMADLCRQMLAFAGRSRCEPRAVRINALVQDSIRLLQTVLPANVAIRYNLAADLPGAVVDDTQFRQIVINLVMNAADAIGEQPGTITMSTRLHEPSAAELEDAELPQPTAPFILFEVSDDGPGMPEHVQSRIFEPFYSTKGEGRGLGLAAVAGIIRSHGGLISVSSEPGQGSSFRVLLPTAAEVLHAREPRERVRLTAAAR